MTTTRVAEGSCRTCEVIKALKNAWLHRKRRLDGSERDQVVEADLASAYVEDLALGFAALLEGTPASAAANDQVTGAPPVPSPLPLLSRSPRSA